MPEYNRRTLVRGAAWSIPVVAVAAQVPAFAGSVNAPRPISATACRQTAGSKCYRFVLTFAQPTQDWELELTSVILTNTTTPNGIEVVGATNPGMFTVSSTSNMNVWTLVACTTGNLANAVNVQFTYTATSTSGGQPVPVVYDFPSTDVCK